MSTRSSSSSSSGGAGGFGSLGASVRFNGDATLFPVYKFNMLALLRMHQLHEVVAKPLPKRAVAGAAQALAASAAASPAASAAASAAASLAQSHMGDGAPAVGETRGANAGGSAGGSAASGSAGGSAALDDLVSSADQQWYERADRAFGLIVLSFTSSTLTNLVRQVPVGDAHAVWNLLLARYERQSVASQAHIMEQFLSARMEEGEHIDSFVARIKNIVAMLADMEEPVQIGMQKHVLLKGLPPSYSTLVMSLGLQQGRLKFDDIVLHLIDHQEELLRKNGDNGGASSGAGSRHDDVASFAGQAGAGAPWQQGAHRGGRGGGNGFRGGRGGGRGGGQGGRGGGSGNNNNQNQFSGGAGQGGADTRACFGCNQVGHISFDCPRNKNAIKCFNCRRLGHTNQQCPGSRRRGGGGGGGGGSGGAHQQHSGQGSGMAAVEQDDDEDGDEAAWMMAEVEVANTASTSSAGPDVRDSVEFILDSAATRHLVGDPSLLSDLLAPIHPIRVKIADGSIMEMRQTGTCRLSSAVVLQDVACDPRIVSNLVSLGRITKKEPNGEALYSVHFEEQAAVVTHKLSGKTVLEFKRRPGSGLYTLHVPRGYFSTAGPATKHHKPEAAFTADDRAATPAIVVPQPNVGVAVPQQQQLLSMGQSGVQQMSADRLWHLRMGHISMRGLRVLSSGGALRGLPQRLGIPESGSALPPPTCEGCALGKAHRAKFSREKDPAVAATHCLQRVHADLCGPVVIPLDETQDQLIRASLGGEHAVFVSSKLDEFSHRAWVSMLSNKSQAAADVEKWKARVEKQSGRMLQEFHTDGGGEYMKLKEFFAAHGIEHSVTQAYTPQHNGMAERLNRTLFEMARAMLQHARLPPVFWEEAILAAVYLRNRCLTTAPVGTEGAVRVKTPEEMWNGVKPNVGNIRVFGSDCYITTPKETREAGKLAARSSKAILVGYAANGGWRMLSLETGQIVASRDVTINENQFTFRCEELAAAIGTAGAGNYELPPEDKLDETLGGMSFKQQMEIAKRWSKEEEESRIAKANSSGAAASKATATIPAAAAASSSSSTAAASPAAPIANAKKKINSAAVKPAKATKVAIHPVPGVKAPAATAPVPAAVHAADAPGSTAAAPAAAAAAAAAAAVPTAPAVSASGRPQRTTQAPDRLTYGQLACAFVSSDRAVEAHVPLSSVDASSVDPVDFTDAMSRKEAPEWKGATDSEMAAHARNGTWVVVELPPNRVPIGNKWVFKTKRRADGVRERLKARLVAKGFKQRYGVDFVNTWSPAVKYKTVRIVFALSTRWDLNLESLDVETAFLNAKMKEEVYMDLPEGYEYQLIQQALAAMGGSASAAAACDTSRFVCLLVMCLYGTKQASMEWNREVNGTLVLKLGFTRSVCDPCLYWRVSRTGRLILLCLFVDDLLSAHHQADAAEWRELKAKFMSIYRCKDNGTVYSLLGMRILRDRANRIMSIDQAVYVQQLVEQSGMANSKSYDTPAQPGVRLVSAAAAAAAAAGAAPAKPEAIQASWERKKKIEKWIGTALYAAMATRPDVAFAVNQVARFMQEPDELHFTAAKRIIRYFRATAHMALVYDCGAAMETNNKCEELDLSHCARTQTTSSSAVGLYASGPAPPAQVRPVQDECVVITAYCDADWGGCTDTRRSTSGYVIFIFGCAVCWMSKKQKSVATSTTEAEYMAFGLVTAEVQWVHQLLAELGLRAAVEYPAEDELVPDSGAFMDAPTSSSSGAEATAAAASSASSSSSSASSPAAHAAGPDAGCMTRVWSDNQAAISQVKGDSDYHVRSKHVDIRHHYVKDVLKREEMRLEWVPSVEQQADIFTKALDAPTFATLRDQIMGPQGRIRGGAGAAAAKIEEKKNGEKQQSKQQPEQQQSESAMMTVEVGGPARHPLTYLEVMQGRPGSSTRGGVTHGRPDQQPPLPRSTPLHTAVHTFLEIHSATKELPRHLKTRPHPGLGKGKANLDTQA